MSLPLDLADLIANKTQYNIPEYNLQEDVYTNIYIGDKQVLGTLKVVDDIAYEYIVLQDWCTQFGERYETILALLSSLMLRWTTTHHISGIDTFRPLHWVEDEVIVVEQVDDVVESQTYSSVVVCGKDTAIDLAVRLGHITKRS